MANKMLRKYSDWLVDSANGKMKMMMVGYVLCMVLYFALNILLKIRLSPYFEMKGVWLDMGWYMLIYSPWDVFPGYLLRGISPGYDISVFSIQAPMIVFLNALVEEIEFRVIPITIVSYLLGRSFSSREKNAIILLAVAIASSALFGYIHGGVDHIFVQGVLGLIWSFIYMKCGGVITELEGRAAAWSVIRALLAVTLVHSLYNYSIYVYNALFLALGYINFGP